MGRKIFLNWDWEFTVNVGMAYGWRPLEMFPQGKSCWCATLKKGPTKQHCKGGEPSLTPFRSTPSFENMLPRAIPSLLMRLFEIYAPANLMWGVPESSKRQRRVPNSASCSSPFPGTICCATWHWPQPQDPAPSTTSCSQIMTPPGLVRQTKLSSCLSTRGTRPALPCWEWTFKCRPRWPHCIPRKNVFYMLHR